MSHNTVGKKEKQPKSEDSLVRRLTERDDHISYWDSRLKTAELRRLRDYHNKEKEHGERKVG